MGGGGELGEARVVANGRAERSALGCFVVGYGVMHHSGFFGTSEVGRGTRLAD